MHFMVRKVALATIPIINIDVPFCIRVAEIANHATEELRAKSEVNCSNKHETLNSTITQLLELRFIPYDLHNRHLVLPHVYKACHKHSYQPSDKYRSECNDTDLHYDNGITAVWVQFHRKSGGSTANPCDVTVIPDCHDGRGGEGGAGRDAAVVVCSVRVRGNAGPQTGDSG